MITINRQSLVHTVLGHSYIFFFFSLLVGFLLDLVIPLRFDGLWAEWLGLFFIVVGPMVIFWAQQTSQKMHTKVICNLDSKICEDDFFQGPYKFTRSPTHLGIFIMLIGLGLIMFSTWIITTTMVSYFITRYIFIHKEEKLLEEKYGDAYLVYKSRVRI
jgi:protein-S-isoprenylcysteine O-methyltransferase Ste14